MRRRRSTDLMSTRERGFSLTANDPLFSSLDLNPGALSPSLPFSRQNAPEVRSRLLDVEDLRLFTPDLQSPLRSSRRWKVRLTTPPTTKRGKPVSLSQSAIAFQYPKYVAKCVRRKMRREVLLAMGRGGGGHRPPKRNQWSDVRC